MQGDKMNIGKMTSLLAVFFSFLMLASTVSAGWFDDWDDFSDNVDRMVDEYLDLANNTGWASQDFVTGQTLDHDCKGNYERINCTTLGQTTCYLTTNNQLLFQYGGYTVPNTEDLLFLERQPSDTPTNEQTVQNSLSYSHNCSWYDSCSKTVSVTVECPTGYKLKESWIDIDHRKRFYEPGHDEGFNWARWTFKSEHTIHRMSVAAMAYAKCVPIDPIPRPVYACPPNYQISKVCANREHETVSGDNLYFGQFINNQLGGGKVLSYLNEIVLRKYYYPPEAKIDITEQTLINEGFAYDNPTLHMNVSCTELSPNEEILQCRLDLGDGTDMEIGTSGNVRSEYITHTYDWYAQRNYELRLEAVSSQGGATKLEKMIVFQRPGDAPLGTSAYPDGITISSPSEGSYAGRYSRLNISFGSPFSEAYWIVYPESNPPEMVNTGYGFAIIPDVRDGLPLNFGQTNGGSNDAYLVDELLVENSVWTNNQGLKHGENYVVKAITRTEIDNGHSSSGWNIDLPSDYTMDEKSVTFTLDIVRPTLDNAVPRRGDTASGSNFTVETSDDLSGVKHCLVELYRGNELLGFDTVTPSNGVCTYSPSNVSVGDQLHVRWMAFDNANNFSEMVESGTLTYTAPAPPPAPPSPPSTGGGGGGGTTSSGGGGGGGFSSSIPPAYKATATKSMASAEDLLGEVEEALAALKGTGVEVPEAEDLLEQGKAKLEEAKGYFDEKKYTMADKLALEAIDLFEQALALIPIVEVVEFSSDYSDGSVSLSQEGIDNLDTARFDDLAKDFEGDVSFKRNLRIINMTDRETGETTVHSELEIFFKNNSGEIRNLVIVDALPTKVSAFFSDEGSQTEAVPENLKSINTPLSYTLKGNKVEYFLPIMSQDEEAKATYYFSAGLTEEAFNSLPDPEFFIRLPTQEKCQAMNCDDNDPNTVDSCSNGICKHEKADTGLAGLIGLLGNNLLAVIIGLIVVVGVGGYLFLKRGKDNAEDFETAEEEAEEVGEYSVPDESQETGEWSSDSADESLTDRTFSEETSELAGIKQEVESKSKPSRKRKKAKPKKKGKKKK